MAISSVGGFAQTYTTADTDGSGGLGFAEIADVRSTLTASSTVAAAVTRSGGLTESFETFDRDSNGEVDSNEFSSAVSSLSNDIANVLLAVQEQRQNAASVLESFQADAYRDLSAASANVVVEVSDTREDSGDTATDEGTDTVLRNVGVDLANRVASAEVDTVVAAVESGSSESASVDVSI